MRSGHLDNGHLSFMTNIIDFRKVVDFVRFELLGDLHMPTPSEFNELSNEEKKEVYRRIWDAHIDACTYMTSALNIAELNDKHK